MVQQYWNARQLRHVFLLSRWGTLTRKALFPLAFCLSPSLSFPYLFRIRLAAPNFQATYSGYLLLDQDLHSFPASSNFHSICHLLGHLSRSRECFTQLPLTGVDWRTFILPLAAWNRPGHSKDLDKRKGAYRDWEGTFCQGTSDNP